MKALLFFFYLAISACAAQELQRLPVVNGTDDQASNASETASQFPQQPSTNNWQQQQQQRPIRPNPGGLSTFPLPPLQNVRPFPNNGNTGSSQGLNPLNQGFNPGLTPGINLGFIPGFNPVWNPVFNPGFNGGFNGGPFAGFGQQQPFPLFGR